MTYSTTMILRAATVCMLLSCFAITAHAQKGGSGDLEHIVINNIEDDFGPFEPESDGTGNDDSNSDDGRLVFWTHGLMGNEAAWSRANTYVADRMGTRDRLESRDWSKIVNTQMFGYPDNPGVDAGAAALAGQLTTVAESFDDLTPDNNVLIAHSFGGLIGRRIYEDYLDAGISLDSRTYGGLVTYGTPHLGAELASNRFLIDEFVVEGCREVGSAWLLDGLPDGVPGIPLVTIQLSTAAMRVAVRASPGRSKLLAA